MYRLQGLQDHLQQSCRLQQVTVGYKRRFAGICMYNYYSYGLSVKNAEVAMWNLQVTEVTGSFIIKLQVTVGYKSKFVYI